MTIIDTHCHLYLEEFKDDIDGVISRAKEEGITKFFLPAINSESLNAMLQLEEKYLNLCPAMIGLHPCYVKDNYKDELKIVETQLKFRRFVAMGEIGLDFFWDKTFAYQQYESFDRQMQWALDLQMPIVIHTRNAMRETLEKVKPYASKGLKGIFHCFSGSYESAKQIVDMGFLLGIGGVLTYKNSGLPQAIEKIAIENFVLETDAPYLTPVPHRGRRNESSYLKFILLKLAEVKGVSMEELARVTSDNTANLFGY